MKSTGVGWARWILAVLALAGMHRFASAGPIEPSDPGSAVSTDGTTSAGSASSSREPSGQRRGLLDPRRIAEASTGRRGLDILLAMQIKPDELGEDSQSVPMGVKGKATAARAAAPIASANPYRTVATQDGFAGAFGALSPMQERVAVTAKQWAGATAAALGGPGVRPAAAGDDAPRAGGTALPMGDPQQVSGLLAAPFMIMQTIREHRDWVVAAAGFTLAWVWFVTVRKQRRIDKSKLRESPRSVGAARRPRAHRPS